MKIEICETCEGEGRVEIHTHYRENEYFSELCHKCNGTGRMLVKTYIISVPFDTKMGEVHKVDKAIHDLINNFGKK